MKANHIPALHKHPIMNVYVARQPIFDANKSLYAYELLFRNGLDNMAHIIDGDEATSKLLSNSFLTIGIESLAGNNRVFINFTQNLLLRQIPALFPGNRTVIEILEDVKPDADVIRSLKDLSQKGYTLALDDFVFQSGMDPFIELADIIKVDFRQIGLEFIKKRLDRIKSTNVRLLAEKVETHEEFRTAVEMGFDYFQGYFFSKPEIVKGKEISSSQFNLIRLISLVNQPDFHFNEIEQLVTRDLGITYKLLRYINSAYFRRFNEINNIRQALTLLGEVEIKRFISFMAMSTIAEGKSAEVIRNSCMRARFCELLGMGSRSLGTAETLFTIGLFSSINAILDEPMEIIVQKLPLSHSVCEALVNREGKLGKLLTLVESYEQGNWEAVNGFAAELRILDEVIPDLYIEACRWTDLLPV